MYFAAEASVKSSEDPALKSLPTKSNITLIQGVCKNLSWFTMVKLEFKENLNVNV